MRRNGPMTLRYLQCVVYVFQWSSSNRLVLFVGYEHHLLQVLYCHVASKVHTDRPLVSTSLIRKNAHACEGVGQSDRCSRDSRETISSHDKGVANSICYLPLLLWHARTPRILEKTHIYRYAIISTVTYWYCACVYFWEQPELCS
jgi:hypothetical protein